MQKKADRTTPSRRPGVFSILFRMLLLGLLFLFMGGAVLFGLQFYYQQAGILVPGVWIADQYVSGLTRLEAAALVESTWNSGDLLLIDSEDMSRTWSTPAGDLGLTVNGVTTADTAYSIGHEKAPHINFAEILLSWRSGTVIQPAAELDAEKVRTHLEFLSSEVDIPPVEGQVQIVDGQAAGINGINGRKINIEETITLLAEDPLAVLNYGLVPMAMEPWEPQITDVSAAADTANRILETGLLVRAYDPVSGEILLWQPTREQISEWLQTQPLDNEYSVSLDQAAWQEDLLAWVGSIGGNRGLDPDQALAAAAENLSNGTAATLVITYSPSTWEVGAGETLSSIASQVGIPAWKILEYNPSLSSTGLVRASTIILPPADINLELPVIPDKRVMISISDQKMWVYENQEQVSEFVISTGIEESPTMPGVFQVLMHEINAYGSRWDLYMPHFLGIYEALPGFTNGIHGLPMLSNGQRLWANVLGQPASYGCIILDLADAEWLYEWAEDGVVVEINR